MTYRTVRDIDRKVRAALPFPAQYAFMKAYNDHDGGEEASEAVAWAAVKAAGFTKGADGFWKRTVDPHLEGTRIKALIAFGNLQAALQKAGGYSKQPRVPSGPKGGQWTAGGYGGGGGGMAPGGDLPMPKTKGAIVGKPKYNFKGGAEKAPYNGTGQKKPEGPQLIAPQLGQGNKAKIAHESDWGQKTFTKPLTDAEITGQDPYLNNPHGFILKNPSQETPVEYNSNPEDIATFTANADPGEGLNGIPFAPWAGPDGDDWTKVEGTGNFDEPEYPSTNGKRLGAGVIIEEPDGRIWTINPLNQFGGYEETFPKGGIEKGLDLRQTAIKEVFEEAGLKVELTEYLGDFERTTSVARYYKGRRTGGDPTGFHWETQATNLVPLDALAENVLHHADKPILALLEGKSVGIQKYLLNRADLIDMGYWMTKKKGGAWSKQLRVPAGLPTGGQWTTYGGGTIGAAYGAAGANLKLQLYGGTGPQAIALNVRIHAMQDHANDTGKLNADATKLLQKDKPKQTYSAAAWESAQEVKAYNDAKAKNPDVIKPADDLVDIDSMDFDALDDGYTPPKSSYAEAPPPIPNVDTNHKQMATSKLNDDLIDHEKVGETNPQGSFDDIGDAYIAGSMQAAINAEMPVNAGIGAAYVYMDDNGKFKATDKQEGVDKFLAGQADKVEYNQHEEWADVSVVANPSKAKEAPRAATPKAAPAATPKAAPAAAFSNTLGTSDQPMKLDQMKKVGAKPGGSSAGAIYKDGNGDKWLVKSYDTSEMAQNEVASSKLYNMMGVETPEMRLIDTGGAYNGGLATASKFMDDLQPFDKSNQKHIKAAQEDFGAHALMANWDAVGLSYDNMMLNPSTGKMVMVDPGGSLNYRAQGTKKGAAYFGGAVIEIDTMRGGPAPNGTVNEQAKAVFSSMTSMQIHESMNKALTGITDKTMGPQKTGAAATTAMGTYMNSPDATATMKIMDGRIQDMTSQKNKIEAEHVTTSTLTIADIGTTAAVATHVDPKIESMANKIMTDGPDMANAASNYMNDQMETAKDGLSGSGAFFYKTEINKLQAMADAGDVDGVLNAKYKPKSASAQKKHKYNPASNETLTTNYGQYSKAYSAALNKAKIEKSKQIAAGTVANGGDSSVAKGSYKKSVEDVLAAQQKIGDKGSESLQTVAYKEALDSISGDPAPMAATQPLGTLPAMPKKPKVNSPSNPNKSLVQAVDEIEAVANSGYANAVAQIQFLTTQFKGPPSFKKKAATYAAEVVSALGGQAAIDALPKTAKVAAANKAIDTGTKIKTEHGIKFEVRSTTVKFDPENVPKPPDFENWGGEPGKKLSGNDTFNKQNNQIVNEIYSKTMQNDLAGVQKIDVPMPENPSVASHVKSYKNKMSTMLGEVGTIIEHTKFVGMEGGSSDPGSVAMALGKSFKAKPTYSLDAKKFGAHVIAGKIDKGAAQAIYAGIPESLILNNPAVKKKLTAQANAASEAAKQGWADHTGKSGNNWSKDVNELLWNSPGTPAYDKALKRAQDAESGAYELPEGLTVSRKVSNGTFQEWADLQGAIITQPSQVSTSINPSIWSGSVYLKMKMGKGVKGAYVGDMKSGLGGEKEVVLPRNSKWLITKVTKGTSGDSLFDGKGGQNTTLVEIVVLPHDPVKD